MAWNAVDSAIKSGVQMNLPANDRWIYVIMANYADKEGKGIYPSLTTLKMVTGLSMSTVQRAVKNLLKVGLIEYGDQELAAHLPVRKRPKVYNMVMTAAKRVTRVLCNVGKMLRPPVDKSVPRPVTLTSEPPRPTGHSDRQIVNNLKINQAQPPAAAPAAPEEAVDLAIGQELRAKIRARRLARQAA